MYQRFDVELDGEIVWPNSDNTLNLPLEFDVFSDFKKVELPIQNVTLKEHRYGEYYLSYLPKKDRFTPILFSGCYALGNCDEYLIVLNENFEEVSRLLLHFHEAPDGNIENYRYSTYEIGESFDIKVTTFDVVEDLDSLERLIKGETLINYEINTDGLIVEK